MAAPGGRWWSACSPRQLRRRCSGRFRLPPLRARCSSPVRRRSVHLDEIGFKFSLAIDSISLWLVALTVVADAAGDRCELRRACPSGRRSTTRGCSLLLIAMLGVFVARDLLLFYVFFELTLIPMFFIIGIWGGAERRYAALKFFLFTFAGVGASRWRACSTWGCTPVAEARRTSTWMASSALRSAHLRPAVRYWIFLAIAGGLCGEGAAVPAAHLAAAGPHRSPDGRHR